VTGIAGEPELLVLALPAAAPGELGALCEFLDARGVAGRQLAFAGGRATLGLPLENLHGLAAFKEALAQKFGARAVLTEGLGMVSAVGVGINADHAHLRRAIAAVEAMDVPIHGAYTSALKLSLLVPGPRVADCVRALHEVLIET
jgi:hypothetical protein